MNRTIELNVTQPMMVEQAHLFQELPETDASKETLFGRCLLGEYTTWFFKEDDEVVGLVFFKVDHPAAFITGIVLKGKTKVFYDIFYDKLREYRFRYLKAASPLPQERFEGFSGFKKLYSIYGKEL